MLDDARTEEPLAGALVDGRYMLVEEVGSGGFGRVFRAEDLYGGPCAVKLVPFARPAERILAQREAARLEESACPGLVAFRGSGRFGPTGRGFVYIAMELGERSLHEHIERTGPLPARGIRQLVLSLLDTLDHLHARGLVHGDVKPGNLVHVKDGWKLCDLGAATPPGRRDPDAPGPHPSGTPEFMAPEVFDGDVSPAADLWSVGLVVHQCAAGKSPFPVLGLPREAIALLVRATDPCIDPSLPTPLAAIVRGCLERDPARRLTSAHVRALLAQPLDAPPRPAAPRHGWVGVALAWCAALTALVWAIARG